MTGTKRVLLVIAGVACVSPVARVAACGNVRGIPSDCIMRVFECDPPGAGPANAPRELSRVHMEGNWAWSACTPSSDGEANLVNLAEEFEVLFGDERHRLARAPYVPDVKWDASERRFAYWTLDAGPPRARAIGIADVRSTSESRQLRKGTADAALESFSWVPGRDELLVLEQRLVNGESTGAVVHVDVTTGLARDLLVEDGAMDFVSTLHHRASAGGAPVALVGSHAGALRLLDCVSGQVQPLGVPSAAVYNFDLSLDGTWAAVFYRREVIADDGQKYAGVYLLDLAGLAASKPGAATRVYDGVDVDTLWLSPAADRCLVATHWGVLCVGVPAPGAAMAPILTRRDEDPEVKGACFDPTGSKIAITQGNRLLVHDLATGATIEVARFGDPTKTFAAEPRWTAAKLVVSTFERP